MAHLQLRCYCSSSFSSSEIHNLVLRGNTRTPSLRPPTPIVSVPRSRSTHHFSPLHLTRSSTSSSTHDPTPLSLSQQGGGTRDDGSNGNLGGGGGGGDDGSSGDRHDDDDQVSDGLIGLFLSGWRSRVYADPQFPFKLLMEEVVGLTSCVLGDMASRPNFGLNELDFVFSTLVVGAILNFVLMYLLAPTAATSSSLTFSYSFPKSHMFEAGAYSLLDRFGTLVYKGTVFACVGFAAGLVGTAISNGLIKVRKKMDPRFETPNEAPPTVLNALTWAAHMGVSCNLRYQTLTGLEFLLAKGLSPMGFKASVIVLRCLNNVMGGVSFVMLARLTGSQQQQQLNSTLKQDSHNNIRKAH